MINYHQPLIPGAVYHLFSRAVGSEKLFLCGENFRFFLQKSEQHTFCVADYFTYSLLPNHFHVLVRIKSLETIITAFEATKKKKYIPLETNLPDFIMERFSNWLNAYAKAFNKTYNRNGALFSDYLKRNLADDDASFRSFVFYIHKNAVHHGLTGAIGEWPYDGYKSLISVGTTRLIRDEMMAFFGGREHFIDFHQRPIALKNADFTDL